MKCVILVHHQMASLKSKLFLMYVYCDCLYSKSVKQEKLG